AGEHEAREGLGAGDVGALADVDEQRRVVDVERLEAREAQGRAALGRLARRDAAQRVGERGDVLWRGAAAAPGEVDPAGARPLADLARHRLRRVLVLAEGVGQARVRMARGEPLSDARE